MLDYKNFESEFSIIFDGISRITLSSAKENKIRYNLADEIGTSEERAHSAFIKGQEIIRFCFKNHSLWLRITLWDDKSEEGLLDSGLILKRADKWFKGIYNGENILYLYYTRFDSELINPIIRAIVNNELGISPYSNITCYFINFDIPLIANIYDDRGIDILTFNDDFYTGLKKQNF